MRSEIAGALFPVEKGEEQRSVEEALESSSPQREKGDPLGSPLFCFLRLVQVYALEGYWTARVGEGFESLVTSEFRFGNEDSGSASQQVSESAAEKGWRSRTLPHRTRKDAAPQVRRRLASRSKSVRHPPYEAKP